MMTGIVQSVGINGVNQRKDVRIIQAYLNHFTAWKKKIEPLKIDGYAGRKTFHAIKQFQLQAIGMKSPDGRVDPNGKTFRYLTMYYNQEQQKALEIDALKNSGASTNLAITDKFIASLAGLHGFTVSYKSSIKKAEESYLSMPGQLLKLLSKNQA